MLGRVFPFHPECAPCRVYSLTIQHCVAGLYYGITIFIVSFATAMTVMTLNVHNKGKRGAEVPSIVRKICFGVLAKILCIKMRSNASGADEKVRSSWLTMTATLRARLSLSPSTTVS